MPAFLELEEAVGRWWHRWASAAASYPHYPGAAVELETLRARLGLFFRAMGGPGGVRLAAASEIASDHRLTVRQRLGLGEREPVQRATLDGEILALPPRLDHCADRWLNEQLYFWLVAFLAHAPAALPRPADPLQRDILILRMARAVTRRVLARWPGLRQPHAALAPALRGARPRRRLQGWEAAVEETVLHGLGGEAPRTEAGRAVTAAVADAAAMPVDSFIAPRGYRPFLPVPLWGEVVARPPTPGQLGEDEPGGDGAQADERRRPARRGETDQAEREDSLILNRFETILAVAEMVNVNRDVDDDDSDSARESADALEEITLGRTGRRPGARLKLDLELAPAEVDATPLAGEYAYKEWDYQRQAYHADHCRVVAGPLTDEGEDWVPDAAARRRIRAVRRQFEALRPKRETFFACSDGEDLDLNALVRSVSDLRAGGAGSDRVYVQTRNAARDLAVAVLVDASLSTDSWIDNHRVLDVEKEAVLALSHGLTACGDAHAIFTFTSRKRRWVSVNTVKGFDEPIAGAATRRLQALRPGHYTRIGAAVRHVTAGLAERPQRHRLLLLLTDGKPNDLDHYEGRYGVEDTRKAIREARNARLSVFGITVDKKARDYFPYVFGRGGYAIVGNMGRLPGALPALYRQVVG